MYSDIKISIIVSAYNVGPWISRCIDSILSQKHKNFELIIINDGSTDETRNIIDKYAAVDKRIVPIHQNNKGLIEVREKGIAIASGQYIGFVDGDDTISPDMYEKLLKNALDYNSDISSCGILYCFYDGRKKTMHGTGKIMFFDKIGGVKALLKGEIIEPSLCNKLYARDLLINSCLDKSVINNEDLLRNYVLFSRAKRVVFEDFCGYEYWRRDNSMSNNYMKVTVAKNILKARRKILSVSIPEVSNEAHYSMISALISSYASLENSNEYNKKSIQKKCRDELYEYKKYFFTLSNKQKISAYMILISPSLYSLVQKLHKLYIHWKINKQSEAIRSND